MKLFKFLSITLILFILSIKSTLPISAAYIQGGEVIDISPNNSLENPYLFGSNITSNASISGDLIAAGGNITIKGSTTGSINAAGGNLLLNSKIGNSLRVAGGDIRISNQIEKDVVVAGGSLTIDKNASIGGDLIFTGGTLIVEGNIKGNLIAYAGSVILKNKIGGNVNGEMGSLQVKEGSEIGGNLTYTSSQKAIISDSAIIHGEQMYHQSSNKNETNPVTKFFAAGTLFKLFTDILYALLLIYLIPGILKKLSRQARSKPLKSSLIGLAFLLIAPFAAIFLLLIIWLGISVFLIYFLLLIIALVISKILFGWYLLDWWAKRNKKIYNLDWKAGVLGPSLLMVLFLIPVIGWLFIVAIYLISLGAILLTIQQLRNVPEK